VAVRIRLKRLGRARRAFWRICATDKRAARDGCVIEELGNYDPLLGDEDKVKIHRERVVHWLKAGASPSKTVTELLAHLGLDAKGNEVPPRPWKKKKKKAPPPKAAERLAAEKAKPKEEAPPAEEAAPVPDEAQPEAQAEAPEAPPDEPAAEAQPDEQPPAEGQPDQAESPEPDAASQAQQNEPSEEDAPE
jgi:small subunit ribosomal protein S16